MGAIKVIDRQIQRGRYLETFYLAAGLDLATLNADTTLRVL